MKKSKKNFLILIITLAIILIIMLICLVAFGKREKSDENSTNITEEYVTEDDLAIIKKLKKMKERDRIEYYFRTFYEYIENGEHDKAYELLNDEFKQTYFPTCQEFKNYCNDTFTEMMNIRCDNIERNDNVYVLWIYLSDLINGSSDDEKKINVVIMENDYYDFELSFSVI